MHPLVDLTAGRLGQPLVRIRVRARARARVRASVRG